MPSVSNLFKRGGLKWTPDADSINSPENVLLRADNMVPDQTGAMAVRTGSSKTYSGLNNSATVHSLHTVELANGTTYKVCGVGSKVYINGVDQGDTFTGSGDIAIGDDSYQIFMARGTTKKKFDGTSFMDWAIPKPEGRVTLAAVTAITKSAAGFDNSESPGTTCTEGSMAFTTDSGGNANSAEILTPASATSRGTISRLFTTDQDFLDISGAVGSETDLFDIMVKLAEPTRSQSIKIVFGADDSSTEPFTTNRFEFEFDLRSTTPVNIKDPKTDGFASYDAAVQAQLDALDPTAITSVKTPTAVRLGVNNLGTTGSPKSAARPDPATWFHLSVTRGQFKRFGSTTTRGWNTIRGFQVVYKAQDGYTSTATFSDAMMIGGGDRSLTGAFKCVIRAARETDVYTELGPPSEESSIINLNHETLQITIPATTVESLPNNIDNFWVYLFGGFLDTYYRFAVVSAQPQSGQTLEELTTADGSNFDDADERSRLTSHGMTMEANAGTSQIVITIDKSELDALTENERLDPYQSGPVDNIVSIAGPWKGRMFTLQSDGYVYPSSVRNPSGFNTIQVMDLTKYGDPLWMAKTSSGIYVGMEKDIVYLAGSGDESDDLTVIDLIPQPMGVGNPPIDSSFHVDGNAIFYRSSDGLMMLTGSNLQPVPTEGTSLLWRGQARHGVNAINTSTGRFRMTIDNLMLYVLVPEGSETSGNVIYRYSFESRQWSRLVYSQVSDFHSIHKCPDGSLIAGDNEGNLWLLDTGNNDNNEAITITILTTVVDGGNPLAYKDPFDIQIHCNTGGNTGTLEVFKDNTVDAVADYTFACTGNGVYRINASDIGKFLRAQLQFTGSFRIFTLQYFDLSFRARPQHSMFLDTGYIVPAEPGDMVWISEVEFDAICSDDVTMKLYLDDTLHYSVSVDTTDDIRTTYLIPVPRGTKSRRPRLVFQSDGSNAEGSVGFDCYGVRLKVRSSGNQSGDSYIKAYPVGEAA